MSTSNAVVQDVLHEQREAGVVTLTLNRPERRNALNVEMSLALNEALRRAATDTGVRAVVLTGAGEAFCSGGDVKAMAQNAGAPQNPVERALVLRERTEASRLLYTMPKPTIALIGGAAAGAGLALALSCDFRVAVSGAKLTTAFAKVGLAGDFGMAYLLPRLVGGAKARELMLLSPILTSEDALALGLVHRVYASGQFESEARAFVQSLAQGPTLAMGLMKQNLNAALELAMGSSLDAESGNQIACFSTQDHKEAAAAFVEKRAPRFVGH